MLEGRIREKIGSSEKGIGGERLWGRDWERANRGPKGGRCRFDEDPLKMIYRRHQSSDEVLFFSK